MNEEEKKEEIQPEVNQTEEQVEEQIPPQEQPAVETIQPEINMQEDISIQEDAVGTEPTSPEPKKNGKKAAITFILILLIIGIAAAGVYMYQNMKEEDNKPAKETKVEEKKSPYYITSNELQNFDLYFLQLENKQENKLYSPLSIKYALEMLAEGSKGESKKQIDNIIGKYVAKKYENNKNMSFANAMFIRDTYKDNVLPSYTETLTSKYNAEVIYDSFKNAKTVNGWVNNKTLKLINNLLDDKTVEQLDYVLINALAIDMNWNNQIQAATGSKVPNHYYEIKYDHEKYEECIGVIGAGAEYGSIKFNDNKMNAKTVEIGASINNYDIVKELGEANIRKTVGDEYKKWLAGEGKNFSNAEKDVNKFLDGYIKEINSNYKKAEGSTDFYLYDDKEVKAFGKDLKTYNGTTLQYVGIMPKTTALDNYIKNLKAETVTNVISNLKDIKSENFKEGVVTKVTGNIPLFEFNYELSLMEDLKSLGVSNVFDKSKADLSGLTSEKGAFINTISHKANIEFSNDGIKAAAATTAGGLGDVRAGFEYLYDVPVETIDLTFDKPYMFLIRDKDSGEVWFTGTVYTPTKGENTNK